ncbi:hypothetical protein DMB65_11240 [Flavobacterium cheongpyeongense]|uniref:Uncharacterized protein n=1 Tax=Flavobacterium cheongpyeongense TaxID=2212651 RepID=A0A2V4BP61_9FLAO|nr:hypothetical protein DMB65_11240 [Flavobacterium cheongpyeongense]
MLKKQLFSNIEFEAAVFVFFRIHLSTINYESPTKNYITRNLQSISKFELFKREKLSWFKV